MAVSTDENTGRYMSGAEFKTIRKSLGLTQVELGEIMGLNQQSVCAIERDRPPHPTRQQAAFIRYIAAHQQQDSEPKPKRKKNTLKMTLEQIINEIGGNENVRASLEMAGLEPMTNEEGEEVSVAEKADPATCLLGLRTKEGLTQQQLADSLGIGQSRVAEYERGTRRISVNMAKKISSVYGVHYRCFL